MCGWRILWKEGSTALILRSSNQKHKMNPTTPIPPEGHEILPPEFLREHGAQDGMQWRTKGIKDPKCWTLCPLEKFHEHTLLGFDFAAPIGTMARHTQPESSAAAGESHPSVAATCPTCGRGECSFCSDAWHFNQASHPVAQPAPETPTPETNKAAFYVLGTEFVHTEFARTLERQRDAAEARVRELGEQVTALEQDVQSAQSTYAENQKLLADAGFPSLVNDMQPVFLDEQIKECIKSLDAALSREEALRGALKKFVEDFGWMDGPEGWTEAVLLGREALAAPSPNTVAELRKERDMWKANHDNQVQMRRTLMDRPDLKERAKLVQELIAERDELRALFPAILSALGNGSACAADASLEFLRHIPEDVRLCVGQLRAKLAEAEADLAKTTEERDRYYADATAHIRGQSEILEQLSAAREDSARLDWLEKNGALYDNPHPHFKLNFKVSVLTCHTLHQAIDKALAAGEGK